MNCTHICSTEKPVNPTATKVGRGFWALPAMLITALIAKAWVSRNEKRNGTGRGKVEPKCIEGLRMGAAAKA